MTKKTPEMMESGSAAGTPNHPQFVPDASDASIRQFNLHLVSDSTGETVSTVARACLVQFAGFSATEHVWPMVRTPAQLAKVIGVLEANRGLVIYTLVNPEIRRTLERECRRLKVPCIGLMDPVVTALRRYLGAEARAKPGLQHVMDEDYFLRIDAMQWSLTHDDGQSVHDIDQADVIVLGVSRTSKTPTSIYLANRGIKVANIPIIDGVALPAEVAAARHPLIVGLTKDAKQLVQIRRNRLRLLNQNQDTDYVDIDAVSQEVNAARRLFAQNGWPVIDVSRRSVEETAATILQYFKRHRDKAG